MQNDPIINKAMSILYKVRRLRRLGGFFYRSHIIASVIEYSRLRDRDMLEYSELGSGDA